MPLRPAVRLSRRIAACLALAAVLVTAAPAAASSGVASLDPSFDWWMPDRFGVDGDRDGLIDLPNRRSYVMGATDRACDPGCPDPTFPVVLEASLGGDADPAAFPVIRYEWTLTPEDGPGQTHLRHVPTLVARLPEGTVEVSLRVVVDLSSGSYGVLTSGTIEVSDLLVVAVGDSYASGDGNPERRRNGVVPAAWADGAGSLVVEADHAAARRSSVAWPSQLALGLERADRRSSVTFVSVAASGATIDRGLLGAQNGRLPRPQIDRVAGLVGERDIDLLLVSIGGNDIGFSQLIAGLVDADPWLDPICYENDLENVWASVGDGHWDRASHLIWRISDPFRLRCGTERKDEGAHLAGLDRLPAELDRLAAAIADRLDPPRVLVAEYPDPTGHGSGPEARICDEIVGDAAPLGLHEINRDEQRLGRSNVLDPLNAALEAAAAGHGWTYIDGVVEAFTDGHGYCAEWPAYAPETVAAGFLFLHDALDHPDDWYRNGAIGGTLPVPGPVSWYRTAGQSVALQGPDSRIDTTGTMHPNELGHLALAALAAAALGEG
ncbi:MAG: hypothetical protein KQH83_02435 [Actinobacteria bacterium]|nr:hypothetical protein [Actinomycetota bacterium]